MANSLKMFVRVSKATATNIFAGIAPNTYMRYTKETGRGLQEECHEDVTKYFFQCYEDYLSHLNLEDRSAKIFLKEKVLLEYGPGDIPGLALIFYAKGAKKVYCVDRFALLSLSPFNAHIIDSIIESLPAEEQQRARESFNESGNPLSGFRKECVEYLTNKKGLSGLNNEVDFAYSRAVLEHVNSLKETFDDMYHALRPNGTALHKVDLKSHGLHQENILDFLCWPDFLWYLMYSNKGVPNRHRLDKYRNIVKQSDFKDDLFEIEEECEIEIVNHVKARLQNKFRHVSNKDLRCLSFWMKLTK